MPARGSPPSIAKQRCQFREGKDVPGYYVDERAIDLNALRERLQSSDLIPSQRPLLEGIADKMTALKAAGMHSLADLRVALKSPKSLTQLSGETAIDPNYLRLMRRAVDGFFPKPRSLRELNWLDSNIIDVLEASGIKNTRTLFEATSSGATGLAKETGLDVGDLAELIAISDLCRIQWVSPTFARALIAAGTGSAAAVAKADPDNMFQAIVKANQGAKFYKGKVGMRDIKRLVAAARYVS